MLKWCFHHPYEKFELLLMRSIFSNWYLSRLSTPCFYALKSNFTLSENIFIEKNMLHIFLKSYLKKQTHPSIQYIFVRHRQDISNIFLILKNKYASDWSRHTKHVLYQFPRLLYIYRRLITIPGSHRLWNGDSSYTETISR